MVPWQERSSGGQPMALDTPAGEELAPADFFEVTLQRLAPRHLMSQARRFNSARRSLTA